MARARGRQRFAFRVVAFTALGLLGVAQIAADNRPDAPAEALQPPKRADAKAGRLIRVPLPLTGSVDAQVRRAAERAMTRLPADGARPVLIFELLPTQTQFGEGSNFERALSLARFIASRPMRQYKTVAFVPRSIKGHGVLVALACEEIVMAADAELGPAGIDEPPNEPVDPTVRSGYRQVAESWRTVPAKVALAMLDKEIEVLRVETEVDTQYVDRVELENLKKQHTIKSERTITRPGEMARFTGREARELGFASQLAADRAALARALSLPLDAVEGDPSLTGQWRPIRLELRGPLTGKLLTRTQRMIENEIRSRDANFICLSIDSQGGSAESAIGLAGFLASLDSEKVRTVAYIASEAKGDAALLATACDQIVMHSAAVLGGPGLQELTGEEARLLRESYIASVAHKKSRSWSLPMALIDPTLRVYRYSHRDRNASDYFSEDEAAALPDADRWLRGEEITRPGERLKLSGARAEELGAARHLVQDFGEFREIYGLENDPALVEPGWADTLVEALALRGWELMLLFIGFAALWAELQAPGIGFGGLIAGVCFVWWFWSKHLNGTAGWLEVLLFLGGLMCILLEFFVFPGTAIFGLGGGLMVIVSLVLASQTFIVPHSIAEWSEMRDTMLGLLGVSVGLVFAAIAMRKYFPRAPGFKHLMLQPPTEDEQHTIEAREGVVDFSHLVGHVGQATTPIAPSGKARFGGELVDVISDGDVIGRGQSVEVVSAQGNRVVVRAAARGLTA